MQTNDKKKLLFLSGGSLVGQNVLASLQGRRENLYLIVLNSIAEEPAIFDYDEALLAPSLVEDFDNFVLFFNQVLDKYNPDIIIPCRDEDVAFISELYDNYENLRSKLLCGPSEIAIPMLDKALSWDFSQKLGLPFTPTVFSNADKVEIQQFVLKHGFPILAKPKKGFASRGVRIIVNEKQLNPLIGREDYIFQKYLSNPGDVSRYLNEIEQNGIPLFHSFEETKISIQASVGPSGEIGGILVTEHNMKQGKSEGVKRCKEQSIYHLAEEWVSKIVEAGWKGPLNIQTQKTPSGEIFIYEFNGRFTGATSGRVYLGFDEVGITLKLWLGEFPDSIIKEQNDLVYRAPVSRVLEKSKIEQLKTNKVWKK